MTTMPELNGCQKIDQIVNDHGLSAVLLHLAATTGWNARYLGQANQEKMAEVVRLLTEAGEKMERFEVRHR